MTSADATVPIRSGQTVGFSPREIELTIRMEILEGSGADVGIFHKFEPMFPEPWDDALLQRIGQGVHGGLASVGKPLPPGGIGIQITQLRVSPHVQSESSGENIRQLGNALEALASWIVAALWSGAISFGAPTAA